MGEWARIKGGLFSECGDIISISESVKPEAESFESTTDARA
jgi:hypothetical protein